MAKKNGHLDNVRKISIMRSVMHRTPWLMVGLFGGILAARIVDGFEQTLKDNLYLAAFIPLIVYMSDAVGTQMESFVIRDFAITGPKHFIKYFIRQTLIVIVMSIILSGLMFVYSTYTRDPIEVALTLSFSLFAAMMSSLFTGLLIPYLFNKIKLDPANAAGPIATIIQDLLSVTIYFIIAKAMIG